MLMRQIRHIVTLLKAQSHIFNERNQTLYAEDENKPVRNSQTNFQKSVTIIFIKSNTIFFCAICVIVCNQILQAASSSKQENRCEQKPLLEAHYIVGCPGVPPVLTWCREQHRKCKPQTWQSCEMYMYLGALTGMHQVEELHHRCLTFQQCATLLH